MKNLLILLGLFCSINLFSQTVNADHAYEAVDKTTTVCGKLVTITRRDINKEKFTLLNFCADFPNACFTGRMPVIMESKYQKNELDQYVNKDVCINGLVTIWEDKPEIIVADKSQIFLKK